MTSIVGYSLAAVTVACCLVALAGESASGQVTQGVATNYDPAKVRALYEANCSACHQAAGAGLPGVFPPLKGSGVVNKDDPTKHIQTVLDGMQGKKAGGVAYATPMPPFAAALGDSDIADIIDYERSSWGNHGKPVTAAQVAAARANAKGADHR
jgi:cytochrome c oxidase cbb3-type subunit 2